MLKIIRSLSEIDFQRLTEVYAQSCWENGALNYSNYSANQQILLAEQDLYRDVKCFFRDNRAFYAVWEVDHRYLSVLRIEPYLDGLLLEGLETVKSERGKGYATRLVRAVLSEISQKEKISVYSHIDKENKASIAVHLAAGFEIIRDCAVFADGSVSQNAITMRKIIL